MYASQLHWMGNDPTKPAIAISTGGGTYSDFSVMQGGLSGHDWQVGISYGYTFATLSKFTSVASQCGGYGNQNLGDAMWLAGQATSNGQADQVSLDRVVLDFCSNGSGLVNWSQNAVDINLYNTTVFYNHIGLSNSNSGNVNVYGGTWISLDLAISTAGGPAQLFSGVRAESMKRLLWTPGGTWVKPTTISNFTAAIAWETKRATSTGVVTSSAAKTITVPVQLGRRPGVDPGWVEGDQAILWISPTQAMQIPITGWSNKGGTLTTTGTIPDSTNALLVSPSSCTVNTTAGSNAITINGDPCIYANACIVGAGVGGSDWCSYAFAYDSQTSGHFQPGSSVAGATVTNAQVYVSTNHWGQCQVALPASGPFVVQNSYLGGTGSHFQWCGGGTVTFEGNMFPDNAPNPLWYVNANLPPDINWRNNVTNYGAYNLGAGNVQPKMANRDVTNQVQDVSVYNVKSDGRVMNCTATAGSTTVTCGNGAFNASDVGRLMLLFGNVGNYTGQVRMGTFATPPTPTYVPMTVAGCPGCTSSGPQDSVNPIAPVQFIDTGDGCSTKPQGTATLGAAITNTSGGQSLTVTLAAGSTMTFANGDHFLIDNDEFYVFGAPTNQGSFTARRIPVTGPTHAVGAPIRGVWSIGSAPYAWVTLDANGIPVTGSPIVFRDEVFLGDGCTRPPTVGTVLNVNGTVQFTGGTMIRGDWPTVITAVTSATTVTVADAPPAAGNAVTVVGTDDHDAWQQACNSRGGYGDFTFRGTSLVSRGFQCNNANLHLSGSGQNAHVGDPNGSVIVYAGKGDVQKDARGHDWIIQPNQGYGVRLSRFGLVGNTQARPYGIFLGFGMPGDAGAGIAQQGIFDQLWIGWDWGDPQPGGVAAGYSLQSCIYAGGPSGNVDFNTVSNVYCYNAEVGFDGRWTQAVLWKMNKISVEHSNIGFACWAGFSSVEDYYTERNRLDIMLGSPTSIPGDPVTACGGFQYGPMTYGGESSSMMLDISPLSATSSANISGGIGLMINSQGPPYGREPNINPSLNMVDVSRATYNFSWNSTMPAPNGRQTYVLLPPGGSNGTSLSLTAVPPEAIRYAPGGTSSLANASYDLYGNLVRPTFSMKFGDGTGALAEVNAMTNGTFGPGLSQPNGLRMGNWNSTILEDDKWYQKVTGNVWVTSARPPGQTDATGGTAVYWVGLAPYCPAGNGTTACPGPTTYNYQLTCVDGRGLETAPLTSTFHGATTGTPGSWVGNQFVFHTTNTTLSATTYNHMTFQQMRGCAGYNLYGDNGVGGTIGWMAYLSASKLKGPVFDDRGQWPKSTRVPPTATQSGLMEAERIISDTTVTTQNVVINPNPASVVAAAFATPIIPDPNKSFTILSPNSLSSLTIHVPDVGDPAIESSTGHVSITGGGGGGPGPSPSLSVRTMTGSGPTTATDDVILANCSSACTITVGAYNRIVRIKRIGSGVVTISPASGSIDGSTSTQLALRFQSLSVVFDGTNFWLI
jgi:hypothetical protein